MQTRSLLLPHVVGATMSLSLGWYLIPSHDGSGAGVALVTSGALLVVILNWRARKNMTITLPVRQCVYGALAGVVIVLVTTIVQQAISPLAGGGAAAVILGVAGIVYIVAEYLLISPLLQRQWKQA